MLFNCGPHSVGRERKHALSLWKSVDIPNPCAYSSLPFTSSLCCFAAQQLFGVLHSTLTYTLMLRKDLILIPKTETFPPACCRQRLTDVVSSLLSHDTTYSTPHLIRSPYFHWVTVWMLIFRNSIKILFFQNDPSQRVSTAAKPLNSVCISCKKIPRMVGRVGGWLSSRLWNTTEKERAQKLKAWHTKLILDVCNTFVKLGAFDVSPTTHFMRVALLRSCLRQERPRQQRATCERVMQHVNVLTPVPMGYPLQCCCSHGGRWY